MRKSLGLLAALAATMALFALNAGQALASHVQCGDTITQDVTLDSDVICPPEARTPATPAIDIVHQQTGGSVTLNLNGYTVFGTISGGCRDCRDFHHLEVRNGAVEDGEVSLRWSDEAVIRDLRVKRGAIGAGHVGHATIVNNSVVAGPDVGIGASNSAMLIADNYVAGTQGRAGILTPSTVSGTIRDNVSVRNAGHGIEASGVRIVVSDNVADRNGRNGIVVDDFGATVTGNHTWWNGDLGIEGIEDTMGGGNWAKHNGNPLQCVPESLCSTTGKPKGH